jgi:hypothetical protein
MLEDNVTLKTASGLEIQALKLEGGYVSMQVKNRRISKPRHIQQLMTEQINRLRQNSELDDIQRARAIAYLSTVSLTAMRDGELAEKVNELEAKLDEMIQAQQAKISR